jgi:anti-sigma factor RsiW
MRTRNVTCDELRSVLHGYVDGELDLVRGLEAERHLDACAACARLRDQQQVLRQALGNAALYHPAPDDLRQRIRSSFRPHASRAHFPRLTWPVLGVAASLALVLLLAWIVVRGRPALTAEEPVTQLVLASHARSLIGDHLLDVESSDQHTVKPWLDERLDFAPPVKDLAGEGFPLAGGRLEYVDQRPAAALVYRRHKHIINLFVWPAAEPDEAPRAETRRGYNLVHWTKGGLTCWAVSDLNPDELRLFVELIRG